MKKVFLIAILSLTTFFYCNAQELGVRFGYFSAGSAAVDGVFSLAQFSRIHADVSFYEGGVGIEALWDFVYKPLSTEAFNWYAGVGPYMEISDPFYLGIKGELGLEYRFNEVPIVIGADWRPGFSIIETTNFYGGGCGFNIRYVFGN